MDLLSSRPFWPIRDGLPATFPPLEEHSSCEVAVIGGGISGALIARELAAAGVSVVVLDRREAAHGSTAGNTGLLLYELDMMLHRLARRIGRECAERAYWRCCRSVETFGKLVQRERLACDFAVKDSLFLAAVPAHAAQLRKEFEARRAANLDVEWWSRKRIAAQSSLPHAAGIRSTAAELDAYRFTYGVLLAAQRAGARIHDRTTVTRRINRKNGVELRTDRDRRVRARHLVVATGYETEISRSLEFGKLHSTYALVTEPIAGEFAGWPAGRCLIWDTGNPYLYLRTTSDNRAIIGGYDDLFYGPRERDRRLPAKTRALLRRFRAFFPRIPVEVATSWAGTFGVSPDGMPFIGQHPRVPHTWFALGFGGNGITFSLIAAEIIRGAVLGEPDPDAALFSYARLTS